ncbi:MAG: peptide deformylase [Acidobacteria bacterium]|jgi:peptide deformylase|nr:peptide deformylase [Acidobacteriota bacterium]
MAILKVSRMGHPVLRTKAHIIEPKRITTPEVQRLIDDMFDTMGEYSGIGLAAPQVHEDVRLFVAGTRAKPVGATIADGDEMPLMALINPELTLIGEPVELGWEGCLSIPDIRGRVPRAPEVRVKAYDRTGKQISFTAKGFPARVIQHEYDHLDGVLFFDRMTSFESLTFLEEYDRYWVRRDGDDDDEDE